MEFYRRTACRLCGGKDLAKVLDLAPSPVADGYVTRERLGEPQEAYPMSLDFCRSCGHVQMLDIVPPEKLFVDYLYETSTSLGLVEHFRKYVEEAVRRYPPAAGSLAVDIGSNDGSFLRFFKEKGLRVLGVDPARRIAEKATAAGIETLPEFFNLDVGRRLRAERGPAAVVTANNAFGHSDDLSSIASGVSQLLAPDGLFICEVSYLADFVTGFLVDTVYHEHLSYHALKPLVGFLDRHGLQVIDAQYVSTKGGSLRIYAQPKGAHRPVAPAVKEVIDREESLGLFSERTFTDLAARLEAVKRKLAALLSDLKSRGRTVAGYGASQSSTTLIHHFGLAQHLSCLFDDNPRKHGRFSPGAHIPVVPSEEIYKRKPDHILLLAWTYAGPILKKHQAYRDGGGRFILPLPDVEAV